MIREPVEARPMRDGTPSRERVIVVIPPWPRTGSTHIFEAMVRAHRDAGRDVGVLVAFEQRSVGRGARYSAEILAGFDFEDPSFISRTEVHDRDKRFVSGSFYQWLGHGCDDTLAMRARRIGCAGIPADVLRFISDGPVSHVHVNHSFNMKLGARLRDLAKRAHGRRPLLVLDTHDVQSKNLDIRQVRNRFTSKISAPEAIEATDLRLCGMADVLFHLSVSDQAYFEDRLPGRRHLYAPPTLGSKIEMSLRDTRSTLPADAEIIYIGTNHAWNAVTVIWLLDHVLPLRPDLAARVGIYGRVGELVERSRPDLVARYGALFKGVADRIEDVYAQSSVVLVPALGGTGVSIKLIEAMCAGRNVVATTGSVRGMPADVAGAAQLAAHDSPQAFADAMAEAYRSGPSAALAALYDRRFSNRAYAEAFGALGNNN
jgi:glycosyltransferase involved in cell wall biosynthesis